MIEAASAELVYADQAGLVYACRPTNVRIERGEFLGILGPSGSGKSSLLYLLSGLKSPTSGQVLVDGEDLARMSDEQRSRMRLKRFGFVFQSPFLLGYLTALENVVLATQDRTTTEEASELLQVLGLGGKLKRLPHELSGGERQRVCVARALIGKPEAIFADEPTAALDHKNGLQVVDLLRKYRGDASLIMVTHDSSMLEGADRVLRIEDGAILQESLAEVPK